jgi:hypothetical protein
MKSLSLALPISTSQKKQSQQLPPVYSLAAKMRRTYKSGGRENLQWGVACMPPSTIDLQQLYPTIK